MAHVQPVCVLVCVQPELAMFTIISSTVADAPRLFLFPSALREVLYVVCALIWMMFAARLVLAWSPSLLGGAAANLFGFAPAIYLPSAQQQHRQPQEVDEEEEEHLMDEEEGSDASLLVLARPLRLETRLSELHLFGECVDLNDDGLTCWNKFEEVLSPGAISLSYRSRIPEFHGSSAAAHFVFSHRNAVVPPIRASAMVAVVE